MALKPARSPAGALHKTLKARLPNLKPGNKDDMALLLGAVQFRNDIKREHQQDMYAAVTAGFEKIRGNKHPDAKTFRTLLKQFRAGVRNTVYPAAAEETAAPAPAAAGE